MSSLSGKAQRLAALARNDTPSPDARARMRSGVIARLALAAPPPTSAPPATPTAPPGASTAAPSTAAASATAPASVVGGSFASGAAAGMVLATLIVAAALLGGLVTASSTPPESARHGLERAAAWTLVITLRGQLALEQPAADTGPVTLPEGSQSRSSESPASPLASTSAAASPRPEHPVPDSPVQLPATRANLAEETALLRKAQESLRAGQATVALHLLDDLAWKHPNGVLREERMVAQVLALCAANRSEEARAAADRLLMETPSSLSSDRVRRSCAFGSSK
jgi:hypothetical protein